MQREIYTVDAKQVNVSENNPQGTYTHVTGYPKDFDSRNYGRNEANPNGNPELAHEAAEADYHEIKRQLGIADAPSRVMYTVTLNRSDGRNMLKVKKGDFPDMTPTPEDEPVEE